MYIYYILSSVVLVRGILTLVFINRSLKYFHDEKKSGLIKNFMSKRKIYIIIPVLREQNRIIHTLQYFIKLTKKFKNVYIIIVTTQREKKSCVSSRTTEEIVNNYIKSNYLENKIFCINYKNTHGYMAHQLNFGVDFIEIRENLNSNPIVAIYNADSRPHPKTFNWIINQLKKVNQNFIFQQSAVFLNNYHCLDKNKNNFKSLFLKTNAILQSRWTLSHELPRLLRQNYGKPFIKRYANAHCVGHGLFIDYKSLLKIGRFPETTVTEDLFLGYLIRAHGLSIKPVPFLENADSPEKFIGALKQKFIWFWGPMSYYDYYKYFRDNFKKEHLKNKLRPVILMAQGLMTGLAWLLSGPIILYLLFYPAVSNSLFLYWVGVLAIVIYGPLQYLYIMIKVNSFLAIGESGEIKIGNNEKIIVSLMSVIAIIVNSLPPYFSIYYELRSKFLGGIINKPKTDE